MLGNGATKRPGAAFIGQPEVLPCYAVTTPETNAQTVGAHAASGTDARTRTGHQPHAQQRPVRFVVSRCILAVALLLMGMSGAGLIGYRLGYAGGNADWLTEPWTARHPDTTRVPAGVSVSPEMPKVRTCRIFAENYPALPAQLRATSPSQGHTTDPIPDEKLAAATNALADTLRFHISPADQDRPPPTWLSTMDTYIAALRASAFVVVNPATPEAVRTGIAELYHQALTPMLKLCHVAA